MEVRTTSCVKVQDMRIEGDNIFITSDEGLKIRLSAYKLGSLGIFQFQIVEGSELNITSEIRPREKSGVIVGVEVLTPTPVSKPSPGARLPSHLAVCAGAV